jgi:uncharacterized membrane protein YfcA
MPNSGFWGYLILGGPKLNLYLWAPLLTFIFTSIMSMGGVGAAFILVPFFYWLGMPISQAGALGLLLVMFNTGTAALNYRNYSVIPLIST